jgi:ATP-binding protein involved in chromosome partitioning
VLANEGLAGDVFGNGSTTNRDYTASAGKMPPMGTRSTDSASPTTGEVAAPSRDEVLAVLGSVIDPELGADIVSLGMVPSVDVGPDGVVTVGIKLTIGGCPLRADIKREVETRIGVHPGVTDVQIVWGEMNSEERTDVMLKARWHAREQAPDTEVPLSCRVLAIASGKGGVGKSSVTVNLAAALAATGNVVGVLDADIWGFSVPRLLGISERMEATRVEGSDKPKIIPNERQVGSGTLKVVSTGFLVGEETALMWRGLMLTKAVEQFLRDVHWGDLDYLLIDMPPGTGDVQMGLARLLPRTDLVIVTTPALAAQKVAQRAADMARRSFLRVVGVIENMSSFTCDHGDAYELFGSGGGNALAEAIGAPLLGQVPLEPAVGFGGDAGTPVSIDGDSAAAVVFREIAARIVAEIAPPSSTATVDMAGCSARMLEAVEIALGPKR